MQEFNFKLEIRVEGKVIEVTPSTVIAESEGVAQDLVEQAVMMEYEDAELINVILL